MFSAIGENSDLTARMCRLIGDFACPKCINPLSTGNWLWDIRMLRTRQIRREFIAKDVITEFDDFEDS